LKKMFANINSNDCGAKKKNIDWNWYGWDIRRRPIIHAYRLLRFPTNRWTSFYAKKKTISRTHRRVQNVTKMRRLFHLSEAVLS